MKATVTQEDTGLRFEIKDDGSEECGEIAATLRSLLERLG